MGWLAGSLLSQLRWRRDTHRLIIIIRRLANLVTKRVLSYRARMLDLESANRESSGG